MKLDKYNKYKLTEKTKNKFLADYRKMMKSIERDSKIVSKLERRWYFIKEEGYPPDCLARVWTASKKEVGTCKHFMTPWESLFDKYVIAWFPVLAPNHPYEK